jgi:cellulase/cellobiase CelA1
MTPMWRMVRRALLSSTLLVALGTGTALAAGAPAAAAPGDVQVRFAITSDWGSGLTADFVIDNHGSTSVDHWTLAFDWRAEITDIWNAKIVSHTGDRYVIEDESWSRRLEPGGHVDFGVTGSPGNDRAGPSHYTVNGEPA